MISVGSMVQVHPEVAAVVDQAEVPRVIGSFNQRKLLTMLTIAIRIVRFYWKQIEPVPSIVLMVIQPWFLQEPN